MRNRSIPILLSTLVLLSACSSDIATESTSELDTRSAQLGIAAVHAVIKNSTRTLGNIRPAPALGVYTSSYLAQGVFVQVASALDGIVAQQKLLSGQRLPTTSETFALLTELATIMQVDIPDMLNRSTNRVDSLNVYIQSLQTTGELAEQKHDELNIHLEQLQDRRRTERDEANSLERQINTAFRNEDYTTAASIQEDFATAEVTLAQTEIEIDQTKDMVKRFADMLEIADERLEVIVRNREILIAGLRVTDMPGIESLRLLEEDRSTRRTNTRDDIFGTQYIQK